MVPGLLPAAASLVVGHGRKDAQASGVMVLGLSCPIACGIFPDRGLNSCAPCWQADSEPLDHQGSLCEALFKGLGWTYQVNGSNGHMSPQFHPNKFNVKMKEADGL